MTPYVLMLALPGVLALLGIRRSRVALLFVALVYWLLISLRFHVGSDWNSYVHMLGTTARQDLSAVLTGREPAFYSLLWVAAQLGFGIGLVNAVSAFVFCWGFFAMARRCYEPLLAVVVATPVLVVVIAMSATRQAIAIGIICYLFASWGRLRTRGRTMTVIIASLFHFSALFNIVFVAIASKLSFVARVAMTLALAVAVTGVIYLFPSRFEFYSSSYGAGPRQVVASGALAHLLFLAAPILPYFLFRRQWRHMFGENKLFDNVAIAVVALIPLIWVASAAALRFSLYFWPVAMYAAGGLPALIRTRGAAWTYRLLIVVASMAILILWLQYSNHAIHYLPYQNWLTAPPWISP